MDLRISGESEAPVLAGRRASERVKQTRASPIYKWTLQPLYPRYSKETLTNFCEAIHNDQEKPGQTQVHPNRGEEAPRLGWYGDANSVTR